MKTFQQRTLDEIEHICEQYGCECTLSQNYGNTGQVNIHFRENPMPCASVTYNFQPGSYTLSMAAGLTRIPSQPGRADYYDFYQENVGQTRFWEALRKMLVNNLGCKLQSPPRVPQPRRM